VAADNRRHSIVGAISDLFAGRPTHPSAVLVEGEPGIGKTTQLRAAAAEARALGFTVLSTTGSVAESVSYAALADLLASVDDDVLAGLPAPQRNALDRVLLHAVDDAAPTDQRAVAAAFLSTIKALTARTPLLLVVDDAQWLDPSSVGVLSFAARRLSGPVCVLAAVRSGSAAAVAWLRQAWPDELRRVTVPPLNLGSTHELIRQHHGHSLSRPALTRIHAISGGNPFYALELSRKAAHATGPDAVLPSTLAEVVSARLRGLGSDAEAVLLTAALATAPTVGLVTHAAPPDLAVDVTAALERAEDAGIIAIDGDRIAFAHPLLAQGVHAAGTVTQLRSTHRRLAEAVADPELRARHLALAAIGSDPTAVDALDVAAAAAHARGAPAAAAELTELAMRLGGDTPERRIQLAGHRFNAGDVLRARDLLEALIAGNGPGPVRSQAYYLLGMVRMFSDGFRESAEVLQAALDEGVGEPPLEVMMRVTLALATYNAGMLDEGLRSATAAVTVAEEVGIPVLLSQALAMRTMLGFMVGEGVDDESMRRALELEGDPSAIHIAVRPSAQSAFLDFLTARDPQAHNVIRRMRQECVESGDENGSNILTFQSIIADVMYGAYAEASTTLGEALEGARQLGSDAAVHGSQMLRAMVTGHTGDVEGSRDAIALSLATAAQTGSPFVLLRTRAQLAFLEVSLEHYDAAWTELEPLVHTLESRPAATEIVHAMFVPDALETAMATGRREVAERLVTLLETNGGRVGRPWMLAIAARGRAMLHAADDDLDAAVAAAERAMEEHARVPMPFQRARSRLLLGQLLRRQRARAAAKSTLEETVAEFDALGARLWAQRARAELAKVTSGRQRQDLTSSETRIAELAATGLTNREVAARLFISPKTVEANLARVYRKLGIRSRAELATKLAAAGGTADG
jgi:DNA-binding CsgD family transcriptional regulator/tetratricopeptide (TPR) repeat protein